MSPRCLTSMTVAALAAGTLACSSSSSSSSEDCLPLPTSAVAYQPPLLVGVSDSATGAPLADLATGSMRSQVESDSLRHWGFPTDSVLTGVLGPGTFTVTVQHQGYATWVRTNVQLTTGNCSVPITTKLTARLQPAP